MKDKTNKRLFSLVLLLGAAFLALFLWGSRQTTKPTHSNQLGTIQVDAAEPSSTVQTNLHFDGLHANPNVQ